MRVRWQGRVVPLLAVLGLVGACRPGASCDLESDTLSRDETAADGRPFFISNLEIGSDGEVAPGQEIQFSFDVERLSDAGSHAVGARLQGSPETMVVMYAYPELPQAAGKVTGSFGASDEKPGARLCGDLQIIPDPNVSLPGGSPKPLSNALPFVLTVR
jgi:hypothetical protein